MAQSKTFVRGRANKPRDLVHAEADSQGEGRELQRHHCEADNKLL